MIGLCFLKFTKAKRIVFSDYQENILENLKKNLIANESNHKHLTNEFDDEINNTAKNEPFDFCPMCFNRISIEKLDWREYENYENKFDLIIGSELIYQGGYIEELVKLIQKILCESI